MDIDYSKKDSRDYIKKQCQEASQTRHNIISPENHTNLVLKLTRTLAVKYGPGVTATEACTLKFASERLDPAIVRVPNFVQFFMNDDDTWPVGYLVMALIEGPTLQQCYAHDADYAPKILSAIAHVHSYTHTVPGPIDGSSARGLLWSEYGAGQKFESPDDLQSYMNQRSIGMASVNFTDSTLRLCHMDIAPRNIIVDRRGIVYLLDWGNAGFYPASFETWSLLLEAHLRPHPLTVQLASCAMEAATKVERDQIRILDKVFSTNQRYAL